MTTDVSGLVGQVRAAERDRLRQVSELAILVGEGRELASRILVKLLLQLVESGGSGHA